MGSEAVTDSFEMQELKHFIIQNKVDGKYLDNQAQRKTFTNAHVHALGKELLQLLEHLPQVEQPLVIKLYHHEFVRFLLLKRRGRGHFA